MRILFTLLFICTLISSAIANVRIEAHDDHSLDKVSAAEHSHSSHKHSGENDKKDSDSSGDCPHFHIHCSSLCLGLLLTLDLGLNPFSDESRVTIFSLQTLSSQDFVNSLYRPPIV